MKSTKRQFSVLKLQQVAKILKTISHPVKLEILEVLESNEPLDVSSICNKIGINCEISMMSHHLSKMKDNGVLVSEKKGNFFFFSTDTTRSLKTGRRFPRTHHPIYTATT